VDVSKIAVQIASEFTGAKAFKQAQTSVDKLERQVKTLGRTLGIALGTAAIVRFGKASVKAFAADDNAARSLGKTLENLGLNTRYAGDALNGYISRLEKQTGVLDDELRPAMDRMLRATGSLTKSQELLGLALDISAGTGKDLTTVSQALQKAYLGNNASLGRLGVGLSKVELTSSSFLEIQDKLTMLFAGQAVSASNSYQGSLNKLTVASNNAKEAIGKGLIDALGILSGSSTVDPAVSAIDKIALKIADLTRGIAKFLRIWKEMLTSFDLFIPAGGYGNVGMGNMSMTLSGQTENALGKKQRLAIEEATKGTAKLLAAEKARLANLKKITAETQKKAALDQASVVLNQANKLFDMDRIQLAAAAMSKQTEEDKVRIRLKTEILDLEEAINSGNVQAAAKLAQSVYNDAKLLGELRGVMVSLGDVPDPFAAWLSTLQQMLATLLAMTAVIPVITTMIGQGGFNAGSARLGESAGNAAAGLPANSLTDFMGFGDTHLGALARQSSNATTINYNINAQGVGDQQIAAVVQNAIQDLNRYGNSTTYAGAI
jgi:hypothetical protein